MGSIEFLGSDFFKNNRLRLREAFSGTAPIVISANYLIQKSSDIAYPFVQDSNFWYLTGVDEPGLTLVLDGDKEYLILPIKDKVRSVFEGEVEQAELENISGIKQLFSYEEGWKYLGKKLSKVKHVATLQPPPSYIESMLMFTSPAKISTVEKIKEFNPEVDLIDLRKVLGNLRSVKQEAELDCLREAIKHTSSLYKTIEKKRAKFDNENQIMAELASYIARNDLEFAYQPIVASGKNALTLHYVRNNSELSSGMPLLIDLGARYSKYCADVTRTVIDGASKRQQVVYNAVLDVQQYAISLLEPGVLIEEYELKVHQYMGEKLRELGLIKSIEKESVREFYPHSTSHFLGIDPHDPGDYSVPLVPGMVLTVEPGIYIKDENIGIRIEDNVLITANGNEILTKSILKDIAKFA